MSIIERFSRWTWFLLPGLLLAGCNAAKQPVYQDKQGLRFTPPSGWVLRAKDDALPAQSSHKHQEIPLPPLDVTGQWKERLLARYDRVSAGHNAWLRLTLADVPSSTPLKACLARRPPGPGWKREAEEENLEVSGLPAARMTFVGRWTNQDYRCEIVAARKENNVYFFTGSFPATDATAGEQIRQALATATWEQ